MTTSSRVPTETTARVFGAPAGGAFASWDGRSSCWRDDELAARGDRAPEFSGGWASFGIARCGSALGLASSGHAAVQECPRSWPTPKVTTNRGSRRSITRDGPWSAPGLEQAAELSEGILPREVESIEEIKSPAARSLWPEGATWCTWGTPRASSGMTSRLRDPESIGSADGRIEDQVAIAEGRPGGWLNPDWVNAHGFAASPPPEWLMGFPAGWTLLPGRKTRPVARPRTGRAGESSPSLDAGRESKRRFRLAARRAARLNALPVARRETGDDLDISRRRPDRARSKTPRSNPDLEADS